MAEKKKSTKKNKTDQVKTVEPIRECDQVQNMLNALKEISHRDYMIFLFGISTGFRISDILKLKVGDVKGRNYIWTSATKTFKPQRVYFTPELQPELDAYTKEKPDDQWLFPSKRNIKNQVDIHRVYRVFNKAGKQAGIATKIGTHTMRKTFGYHFYRQTKDIAQLQEMLQHTSQMITMRYIGITDEQTENAYKGFGYGLNKGVSE